jgi:RNA polymerase sigma-70 factor (ECF subfamily)
VDSDVLNQHLSRIETHWTAVLKAHKGCPDAAAQAALVERYGGAVHRYLLASLRDPDAADDLAQEFALRFLRGDFKNADPGKGRFRDFLKRAVYHLMVDYHRSRKKGPWTPGDLVVEAAGDGGSWDEDLDRDFLDHWREQLMTHAWRALDQAQTRTGQPFAHVLRLRVANPELRSSELAERLSKSLGRTVNAGWVRLNVHRARDMFVESLLAEVERSLENPTRERLEEELIELGLLEHCRSAMRRRSLTTSS